MPSRPCLGCGTLVQGQSYCATCRPRNGSTRAWRQLRARVLKRDGHRCVVVEDGRRCLEVEDLHAGHIIPKSKGGMDTMENLQTECARHNLEKGDR